MPKAALFHVFRLAAALGMGAAASSLGAAEWFVATNGTRAGSGTLASPWDITSALGGQHRIAPGDTVWLRGGAYKYPPKVDSHGFEVRLAGRRQAPVQVRPYARERVTIDGGLNLQEPATDLWIRDLEILVSEPRPDKPVPPDPTYANVNRPAGGLNVYSGARCKFINLILHDNAQGVSWWKGSTDSEVYGCIIYDNGWAGTDRGHGHAIYTQNQEGTKTIADCIMTGGFGFTMHAYGSERAWVDHYLVEGNICYDGGPFLIGGGKPSRDIRVFTNFLYQISMQLGYSAPTNDDCVVRGNVIVNGRLSIDKFRQVVNEDNLVLAAKDHPRPPGARVVLRPNRYDPRRANLAIFNWESQSAVAVDVAAVLKPGERYRLLNPRDFFGPPVLSGTYTGGALKVPVAGEFAAFVLLAEAAR